MVDETGMPWWVKIVVILVGMAVLAAYIGVSWVVPILKFKDEKAIKGMLPKNRLGQQMAAKLKVYAGPEHPHAAQSPTPYVFTQVSQIAK